MEMRKQPDPKDFQEQRQKTCRASATHMEPAGYDSCGDQAIVAPEPGEENCAHQARWSQKSCEDAKQGASNPLGIGIAGGDVVEPQHHPVEDQAQAGQEDALPAVGSSALPHEHSSLHMF